MIYVALAALTVSAVTAVALASLVRSLVRQQARERDLLLNQIMHLSGKTWTAPPSLHERPEPEPRETFRNIEQYPDWALAE